MKRSGFTIVEVVIVIAVLVIIGLLGYTYWNQSHKAEPANSPADQAVSAEAPKTIESSSDLDKAEKALDSASLDDSDLDQAAQQADL